MESVEGMWRQHWLIAVILATAAAATASPVSAQARPNCPDRCGDLHIPFPFGMNEDCYLNDNFLITCNASNVAMLGSTRIEVLNISLQGQLLISSIPAIDCYDESGNQTKRTYSKISVSNFPISYTRNKFIAVGCDTYALVSGRKGHNYTTGCISYCMQREDLINGSCTGIGCCQTFIPKGVWEFFLLVESYYHHQDVWDYNPCSYAFVVEENSYKFSTLDLANMSTDKKFPLVLDWSVRNLTCNDAVKNPESYACKQNSMCYDADNGPGYLCDCSAGYAGNAYLENGCQDVNECEKPSLNQCVDNADCINTMGNYTCLCPKGYQGDGRKDGSGCARRQKSPIQSVVGVSTSISFLFVVIALVFFGVQKRKSVKLRKEYFKQNGGFLLQQLLFKNKNSADAARIFAEEELNKATNDFNKNMVIGKGGFGVVYKGVLADGRIVAIKKSMAIDRTQIEQFVNEVIVLSQIDHPNAVKLLGCCLETPVPLLVYEFITNGTLYHHLHDVDYMYSLTWETRFRIAEETAGALAYMHSVQIIHRDVKSANILLDDKYTTKVSDFGVSRLVPFDQHQISTLVQGTLGYMDPEYFQSGILTEKSDVYSFGVVLAELLTGKKAICSECEERSLALYFISVLKEDRLFEVLEDRVRKEGSAEQLNAVAELARSCLRLEGDQRPTMKSVLQELQTIKQTRLQPAMHLGFEPI